MANTSVGLYIGTETVDLVQLAGSFQRPHLINHGRVSLPPQSAWRSLIRAEETSGPQSTASGGGPQAIHQAEQNVANAVKTLFQKINLSSVRAYTAIAPEAVVIRYFQMPTIPIQERKLAVAFEAKKYLPFKLEELITDFQVVIRRTDPTLMRIMFFGIKKSSTTAYLSLLQSAGCTPLSLEAVPVSLMRLMRQTGQLPPDQVAAVLCLERDTAMISIAGDNLLYLSRNVTIMGSSEPGQAAQPAQEGPSPELLEALINETRVSIDYYRRRFLGEPGVSKVVLYGPGVDPKRAEELTAALDLPVELGNPFKKIPGVKEVPHGFGVAVGLALRGLEKKAGESNILPPEQRRELAGLLKPTAVEAGAAVVLLGLLSFLSIADLSSQEQRINALRGTEIKLPGVQPGATLADLQALQRQHQAQLRFIREISTFRKDHTALLAELTRLLPEEAWLRYASFEDTVATKGDPNALSIQRKKILKLVGGSYVKDQAREFEGINILLAALKADDSFKSVFSTFSLDAVQRTQFQEEEITEFRLTCSSNPQDLRGERP